MMALSMVVIASLIGGGGLGDTIISSLTYLDVGSATIGGAAIVILAIALDRSTAAAGARADPTHPRGSRRPNAAPGAPDGRRDSRSSWSRHWSRGPLGAGAFPSAAQRTRRSRQLDQQRASRGPRARPTRSIPSTSGLRRLPRHLAARAVALVHGREPPWWLMIAGAIAIALTLSGWQSGDHRRRPAHRDRRDGCLARRDGHGVAGDRGDDADAGPRLRGRDLGVGVAAGGARATADARRAADAAAVRLPVPVVALFNVGRVPGVIASVLYAHPVVIRLVTAGLRDVSATAVEAASSFGASRHAAAAQGEDPARPAGDHARHQPGHRHGARGRDRGRASWAAARSATASSSGSSGTQFGDGVVASARHFVPRHRPRSHHPDRRPDARASIARDSCP